MAIHIILGAAGGAIGTALASIIRHEGEDVSIVSCSAPTVDLLDYEQLVRAVAGSSHVYLLADLSYCTQPWEEEWLHFVRNTINACKEARARFVFLDQTCLYSKTEGLVTEYTSFHPAGSKGKILAAATNLLMKEMDEGTIDAAIARAAHYYGPSVTAPNTIGALVFAQLRKGKRPYWPFHPDVPRSLHYLPDLARALYTLAIHDSARGKVWHMPSAKPVITGRVFTDLTAGCMNTRSGPIVARRPWKPWVMKWFSTNRDALYEIRQLEQYPLLLDSSHFELSFQFTPTTYQEGIKATADWFLNYYH